MRSNTVACPILVIVVMTASFADEPHNRSDSSITIGSVTFPVSCSKKARDHIERGLAMFHSFLFDDAELQFATAANLDAGCAMAYWAEAIGLYRPLAYLPRGFTVDLITLGGTSQSGGEQTIDTNRASGRKSGYTFTYTPGEKVNGAIRSYTLTGVPDQVGTTGQRRLFSDESGEVHYNASGAADATSPVIQ